MKLTVLVENNTYIDNYYLGEPGLSFYLESDNKKILFDTGYSNIYLKNASKLGIDLNNIDYLVLSHGHNDHTGGLKYLDQIESTNTKLIAHPNVFLNRNNKGKQIGSPVKLKDLNIKEYIDGTSFYQLTDNLYYLGEIKRTFPFEDRTIGFLDDGTKDEVKDDTALVYKAKEGLFIITACSHSGICNIIKTAKTLLNEEKVIGVIGGFHLLNDSKQLDETINYLKQSNIKDLYPCHCVSLLSKIKMAKELNVHEVGVGLTLNIE